VNGQDSQAEIFDVFLCHNSEDKPAVQEIAQRPAGSLVRKNRLECTKLYDRTDDQLTLDEIEKISA
jgi:hypothetical protein